MPFWSISAVIFEDLWQQQAVASVCIYCHITEAISVTIFRVYLWLCRRERMPQLWLLTAVWSFEVWLAFMIRSVQLNKLLYQQIVKNETFDIWKCYSQTRFIVFIKRIKMLSYSHAERCSVENSRHHSYLTEQQTMLVYCPLIITQVATSKMATHPSPSLSSSSPPTLSDPAFSFQTGLSVWGKRKTKKIHFHK